MTMPEYKALWNAVVSLHQGDIITAADWLNAPQVILGGSTPMDYACTEEGYTEVMDLIGRLRHGVFS